MVGFSSCWHTCVCLFWSRWNSYLEDIVQGSVFQKWNKIIIVQRTGLKVYNVQSRHQNWIENIDSASSVQIKDGWSINCQCHQLVGRNISMKADNSNDSAWMMLCCYLGVADVTDLVNWQLQLLQHCNHFPLSVSRWWRVVVRMDCIQRCAFGIISLHILLLDFEKLSDRMNDLFNNHF